MFVPSRTSDAGPDCGPTVECRECGASHAAEDGARALTEDQTYRCQGSIPDLCVTRLCDACLVRCSLCDLPVCEEHRETVDCYEPECECVQTDVDQADASHCQFHGGRYAEPVPTETLCDLCRAQLARENDKPEAA